MLTLTDEELRELTGYKRPADQLAYLHKRGFQRATIQRGRLILERGHYEAVIAGHNDSRRPKVIPPRLRAAA